MHVDRYMDESFSVKWGLNASANSFGPGQPARTAQADLDRNCLLQDNLFVYQKVILHHNSFGYQNLQ